MSSNSKWFFSEHRPGPFANPAAFKNTLAASSLEIAETLAREAIQNSVDARLESSKPTIHFRIETLKADQKAELTQQLGFHDDEWTGRQSLEFYDHSHLKELSDDSSELRVLYVEDFGTCGLFGDPYSSGYSSHMRKLLFELGNDSKIMGEHKSGGSFGFGGKSVFINAGRHSIVIAHSGFRVQDDGPRGAFSQLIGVGYFEPHDYNGESFVGFAEFAKPNSEPLGRSPWKDEESVEVARSLGFTARDKSQTGSSIMIPGAGVNLNDIRTAVEKWWWPRIVSHDLDVRLFENGEELPPPRPLSRASLRPYIKCYSAIENGAPEEVQLTSIRANGQEVGRLALTLRAKSEETLELDDAEDDQIISGIALIRSPRMVVEYYRGWAKGRIPESCLGVFLASAEVVIDDTLRMSENAAHTVWDYKTPRLKDDPEGVALVQSLLKEVRKKAIDFAKKAQPSIPPSGLHIALLEDFLARALRSGKKGSSLNRPGPSPIHLTHIDPQRLKENGHVFLAGRPAISLDQESNASKVKVTISCKPEEDGRVGKPEYVPISVSGVSELMSSTGLSEFNLDLDPGQSRSFEFRSDPIDPEWSLDFKISAEIV